MIWGYLYFRKPPYYNLQIICCNRLQPPAAATLPAHGRSQPDAQQKHARHQLATEITCHGEAGEVSKLWKKNSCGPQIACNYIQTFLVGISDVN